MASVVTSKIRVDDFEFDHALILAQGEELDSVEITLSGSSIALILAACELLESRENWDEMTDETWDELEAKIALITSEIQV